VSPVFVLWKKELVDTLRDRRTLAMMLLVPIALYPVILFAMGAVMAAGRLRLAQEEIQVALLDDDAQGLLPADRAPAHTQFVRMGRADAEAGIRDGKHVGAAIAVQPGSRLALSEGKAMQVSLLYTQRHDFSMEGRDRVRKVLTALGVQFVEKRLNDAHLPPSYAEPLQVEETDIDFNKDLGPMLASHVLPMILLLMLFLGSFYSAIEVTAGEKERGTLETLLVAPIRPMQVMMGKYLAVCVVAVVATLVNLAAMVGTFRVGLRLAEDAVATLRMSPAQTLVILVSLVPAALLVSALSLAVASLARTYREGQSVLTPLMMVGIIPGVAAQMPGIELNNATALVPLLNVALVIKAVVLGNVSTVPILLTLLSIGVCVAAAVWLAANAFKSEAIRFGGVESWRDLFRAQ
jgi:sodium transport system permease protein